jgi:formate hydrogenlyase subunit 3/multisubunit Na+/H+ antiporter MnhD subunit
LGLPVAPFLAWVLFLAVPAVVGFWDKWNRLEVLPEQKQDQEPDSSDWILWAVAFAALIGFLFWFATWIDPVHPVVGWLRGFGDLVERFFDSPWTLGFLATVGWLSSMGILAGLQQREEATS